MKNGVLLLILSLLLVCGWHAEKAISKSKDVFSIYLVKNSKKIFNSPKKLDVKNLVLEDAPLLTVDSITNYTWHSHRITFPFRVKEGLKKREPLLHYLFVVVANDERIYWGMFKDIDDSFVSSYPAIFLLPRNTTSMSIPNKLIISKAQNLENNVDIRDDVRIYNALKDSGKLLQ
jgi:hypothetical protein